MELAPSAAISVALPRRLMARVDPPALAAWTLAFTLVAYLALSNGGYDTVVRSQVGLAVWWIVLIGAVAGILPARIGTAGWVTIGLLAAFAAWTGLGATWSESAERSTVELGRIAMYLGVVVLAIALQGRAAARHTINGVACAIGLVVALAVLSRLHPQWFPVNDHLEFFGPSTARKLSFPLNYWNGLAALAALGAPLLLAVAIGARTLTGQAVAAAALPVSALCIYLTVSRGGALALAVGIVAFLALVPRRLYVLATLIVTGAASAILVSAASQREALQAALPTAAARHQGDELLWLVLVVCCGAAFVQVALGLAARHLRRPGLLTPGPRATALGAIGVLVVAGVIAGVAGAPAAVGDRWQEFKAPQQIVAPPSRDDVFGRLAIANGNGRYQLWQSALDAGASDPLRGIGPGTFELWWARHATVNGFVRDAHSLYFETLGETGLVGLALLGGLLLWLLATAATRSLRAAPHARLWIAAAAGGLAAFATSATFDWVWELAAIAVAVLALGAVIVAGREDPPLRRETARGGRAPRAVLALLAVAAIGAVVVPMAGAMALGNSRAAAAAGRLDDALAASRTAERLQPYAATAHLQRALVLEDAGALRRAAAAARAATADEPTNWRTWFVLARIDARRGATAAAVADLRHARRLNSRSRLFAQP